MRRTRLVPSRLDAHTERQIAQLMARRDEQLQAMSAIEPSTVAAARAGDQGAAARVQVLGALLVSSR
jgi:hypothetical protein